MTQIAKKGDRFTDPDMPGYDVEVRRVGKAGWVDVFVYDDRTLARWARRMHQGIPASWQRSS